MRGTRLVSLVLLVGAVHAPGEIILYWSTTGITNSSYFYSTAQTNFRPYFVPPTPVTELPAGTYDLFLWGRFVEADDLPAYVFIYSLDLRFEGDAALAENAAYRHRKTGAGAYKRWDNTVGIPLDGSMYAILGNGIEFMYLPYTNHDLSIFHNPSDGYADFLIGAARITGAGGHFETASLDGAAGQGIGVSHFNHEPLPDPEVVPATILFTPEPAALVAVLLLTMPGRRCSRAA
jgi:hypothetical protein